MRSFAGDVMSYSTPRSIALAAVSSAAMALVRLGTYNSLTEANLVKARLESEGIASLIQADDIGSMTPTMNTVRGVRVLVEESDQAEAMEVLERMLPGVD